MDLSCAEHSPLLRLQDTEPLCVVPTAVVLPLVVTLADPAPRAEEQAHGPCCPPPHPPSRSVFRVHQLEHEQSVDGAASLLVGRRI